MKRIRVFIVCMVLIPALKRYAWAVYPPSDMLMEESKQTAQKSAELNPSLAARFEDIAARLEEKERLLGVVVRDLEKDEESLKKSAEKMNKSKTGRTERP
jgi:hypothetical protein